MCDVREHGVIGCAVGALSAALRRPPVAPHPAPRPRRLLNTPAHFNLYWPSAMAKSSSNLSKLPCFLAGQQEGREIWNLREGRRPWKHDGWPHRGIARRSDLSCTNPAPGSTPPQSGAFIIIIYRCFLLSEVLPELGHLLLIGQAFVFPYVFACNYFCSRLCGNKSTEEEAPHPVLTNYLQHYPH